MASEMNLNDSQSRWTRGRLDMAVFSTLHNRPMTAGETNEVTGDTIEQLVYLYARSSLHAFRLRAAAQTLVHSYRSSAISRYLSDMKQNFAKSRVLAVTSMIRSSAAVKSNRLVNMMTTMVQEKISYFRLL